MNKGVIITGAIILTLLLFILLADNKEYKSPDIKVDCDWLTRSLTIVYNKITYSFIAPGENTNGVYLNTNTIQTLGYRVLNDGELVEIFFNDADGLLKSVYANFITKQFQTEYQPILNIPSQNG